MGMRSYVQVVAVTVLHVLIEVGSNEARGDGGKGNCGEPHSAQPLRKALAGRT